MVKNIFLTVCAISLSILGTANANLDPKAFRPKVGSTAILNTFSCSGMKTNSHVADFFFCDAKIQPLDENAKPTEEIYAFGKNSNNPELQLAVDTESIAKEEQAAADEAKRAEAGIPMMENADPILEYIMAIQPPDNSIITVKFLAQATYSGLDGLITNYKIAVIGGSNDNLVGRQFWINTHSR